MAEANTPRRSRGLQFSLRTLLVLMLLIGTYFAGFATSQRIDREALRQAREEAAASRQAELGWQSAAAKELEDERQALAAAHVAAAARARPAKVEPGADISGATMATRDAAARGARPATGPPPRTFVYVNRGGKIYHHWDGISRCHALYDKDGFFKGIKMELSQAEREGYRPCRVCQPDK